MPGELAAARAESPAIYTPNVTEEATPYPQPVDVAVPEQTAEKIYSHIHPDGSISSGTREQAEKICTGMQNMSKEQKDFVFSTHDLVQSLAAQNRVRKEAREKENAGKPIEPPVKLRKGPNSDHEKAAEPKVSSVLKDKPATVMPERPAITSNVDHTAQIENERAQANKTKQSARLDVANERLKTPEIAKTVPAKPDSARPVATANTVLGSKPIAPAKNDETKIVETEPAQHFSDRIPAYEAASKAIANIMMNKGEIASGMTPDQLESKESASSIVIEDDTSLTFIDDESIPDFALETSTAVPELDPADEPRTAEDIEGVKDILESELADSLEAVSLEDSWLADNTDTREFEAPETRTILIDSEALGMAEVIVSEEALLTHQELLEIIRDAPEDQPAASQTDAEIERLVETSGSTEEFPALNIVEIIRAEPAIAEEPATMEQVKTDAQDAQPLEQALAKLSIVLESSSGQPDEPVTKLLAEIAERIVVEPAETQEGTRDNLTAAITPEITQLFVNLLEELGYEDPHHTLISFVSQYGIEALIDTAIYLHQLAESGDQKEYLSGRLPAISSDSPTVPLSTLIGKTIFQIIKPEVHTLALAA